MKIWHPLALALALALAFALALALGREQQPQKSGVASCGLKSLCACWRAAPCALAIMTQERPSPPQPKTATLSPSASRPCALGG